MSAPLNPKFQKRRPLDDVPGLKIDAVLQGRHVLLRSLSLSSCVPSVVGVVPTLFMDICCGCFEARKRPLLSPFFFFLSISSECEGPKVSPVDVWCV